MSYISVEALQQSYGDVTVFEGFNLHVDKGEFVALMGPNACGKSTLLKVLAGALDADSARNIRVKGRIRVNGLPVTRVKRSMIYQNHDAMLLPWRTVYDNIGYPLEIAGLQRRAISERMREFFTEMGIGVEGSECLERAVLTVRKRQLPLGKYPYELSGGQQQMVALLTALIHDPAMLLLDEPFSSLDQQNSLWIQETVSAMAHRKKLTVVMATHSLDEALFLAGRVVFLTPKPARIRKELQVNLPKQRTLQVTTSARYTQLRAEAVSIFKEVMEI